jgi:Protein of unknown function (DUF3108)
MRLFAFAAAALAFAGSHAHAQSVKVDYNLSLAGLSLGTAALSSTFEGSKYQLGGTVKLSGLARMVTGGKGAATAAGSIVGGQVQPTAFAVTAKSSSEQRTLRMGIAGGNVAAVEIDPPYEEKPDRVPVKDADKRGVVDPMSALLMPAVASADMTDPAQCRRTIPVFDGAMRLNIVLTYGETKTLDGPGYAGPVLVCNVRYVPIAGHRPARPATKFMTDNKDISVWLAPVESQKLLVPVRIAVRTMLGMGVAEASSWNVEGDAKVLPTSGRPIRAKDAVNAGAAQ